MNPLVLALDLETSGLSTKDDRMTEFGAVVWDCAQHRPILCLNELISYPEAPPLTPEVVEITRITDEMLFEFGVPISNVLLRLREILPKVEAVVVHGGLGLDKPILERDLQLYLGVTPEELAKTVWVDTMVDFEYPPHMRARALKYLAADHHYLLMHAHRALFDSLATIAIADQHNMNSAIESARTPLIVVKAEVDITRKDEAKTRNYFFHSGTRSWWRKIRLGKLEAERAKCPFTVSIWDNPPNDL